MCSTKLKDQKMIREESRLTTYFISIGNTLGIRAKIGDSHDKAEATRSFSVLVQTHNYLFNFSSPGKQLINLLLCCIEGHVANINRN